MADECPISGSTTPPEIEQDTQPEIQQLNTESKEQIETLQHMPEEETKETVENTVEQVEFPNGNSAPNEGIVVEAIGEIEASQAEVATSYDCDEQETVSSETEQLTATENTTVETQQQNSLEAQATDKNLNSEDTTETKEAEERSSLEKDILDAFRKEREELFKDQAELEDYKSIASAWLKRANNLSGLLAEVSKNCNEDWVGVRQMLTQHTGDPLQELLKGRIEGLELTITKMLGRLPEKATTTFVLQSPEENLAVLDRSGWEALLSGESDPAMRSKKALDKLRNLSNERYKVLTAWRNYAEKSKNIFLNFIERQVLPVIDGVLDGRKNSENLSPKVTENGSSSSRKLLFETYDKVTNLITVSLGEVGVTPMNVNRGDRVDFEKHEPFDIESDPELGNEQIKDVVRIGFEYSTGNGKVVLRSAQVIVVKN